MVYIYHGHDMADHAKAFLPAYCLHRNCTNEIEEMQDMVRIVVYKIAVPIVATLGIIGNILSIIILSQPQFIDCLYLYLKVCKRLLSFKNSFTALCLVM